MPYKFYCVHILVKTIYYALNQGISTILMLGHCNTKFKIENVATKSFTL